jgi:Tol biopolymer transport system component
MIYFDSDMSKSTNTVVYFDWKTVIYIYEALLGENGSFNTLLTYITVKENAKGVKQYSLNISDSERVNNCV